ncbi:hypothetical protein [Phaeobacter sp.]|uniref:hypothetical protein n=1 Tax=Phaeobacter sp. TaxID=1902409 RepID=UPI0025E69502|nr:hypothetical protein [Phaeobacter sp.]
MTLRLDPSKIKGRSFSALEDPVADAADQHAYWEDFNARFFRSNGQDYDSARQSNVANWLSAPDRASFAAMAGVLLEELQQSDTLDDIDLVLLAHWMPDLHLGTSVTNFALHHLGHTGGFGFAISDRGLSAPLFAMDCAARYLRKQGRRALVMTMDQKHLLYRAPLVEALHPENSASVMVLERDSEAGLHYCGYRRRIGVESGDLPRVVDTACRELGLIPEETVLIADETLAGLGEGFARWCPSQTRQMCAAPLRSLMQLDASSPCLMLTRHDSEVCFVGLSPDAPDSSDMRGA